MRRAARKDANHNDIAAHLKTCGFSVLDLSQLGHGKPDMLVARRGFAALVEAKDGSRPLRDRKLNDGQAKFAASWKGVCIKAESPEDAEKQLNLAESFQYLRMSGGKNNGCSG